MITVHNMDTKEKVMFSLPPEEAVIAAHEQSKRNFQTWSYDKPKDHKLFSETNLVYRCGAWWAWKDGKR
ncbi:MAG: hypothetical protein AB9866_21475 [Syntrophobacteraceae bacterium]